MARRFNKEVMMEPFLRNGNKKVEAFLKSIDNDRRSVLSRYQGLFPIINCTVGGGVNCYGVGDIIRRALRPKPDDNLRALEMEHYSTTQVGASAKSGRSVRGESMKDEGVQNSPVIIVTNCPSISPPLLYARWPRAAHRFPPPTVHRWPRAAGAIGSSRWESMVGCGHQTGQCGL